MAVAEKTLLEFLLDLLHNKDALAEFRDDPHAALQHAGLGDCTVDDIKELLPVVLEKVDAEKCAQYEDDCDDDKCYDSEPKHHDDDHHCKPVDCDDEGRPAPHCSPADQVVAHLNYVTNNYSYDSHDTYNTTNNITKIWAGEGSDVNVENHTTNVGDGGTFVGGDNNAPIAHGDGNIFGDGNQVGGDGANAFGTGSATNLEHVGTGDGGVISTGSGTVNSSNAFGDGNQVAGANGVNTDASLHDSGNTTLHTTDNSNSHNITDSQNHTTDNSDTDNSTDNSQHTNIEDSGNTDASTNDSGNTHFDLLHH